MQGKQTYRSSRSLLDDRTQLDELVAQFFLNPFVQTEPVFRALRSLLLDSQEQEHGNARVAKPTIPKSY